MSEPMTQVEKDCDSPEGARLFEREYAYLEASTHLGLTMEELGMSYTELAQLSGRSKSHISQIMQGENITLKTLSELLFAMGRRIKITSEPITARWKEHIPKRKQPAKSK